MRQVKKQEEEKKGAGHAQESKKRGAENETRHGGMRQVNKKRRREQDTRKTNHDITLGRRM
jgi:hypothetical protein